MVQKDNVLPRRSAWRNHHYDEDDTPTTNSYVTILKFKADASRALIVIKNTGAQDLLYTIYGSIKDGLSIPDESDDSWIPVKTDLTLLAGKSKDHSYFYSWGFFYIQAKNKNLNQNTTYKIWAKGD